MLNKNQQIVHDEVVRRFRNREPLTQIDGYA